MLTAGFPVGARGKWFPGNDKILEKMGLSKTLIRRTAESISFITLINTLKTCKTFWGLVHPTKM